jgi:hypothetical protein
MPSPEAGGAPRECRAKPPRISCDVQIDPVLDQA